MIKTHGARKLGRRSGARRMLLRQLATQLIHHERITTTLPRAKELKIYVERMISRIGSIESTLRRRRFTQVWLAPSGFDVDKKFVETILPRSSSRIGGYLRVLKLSDRATDRAKLARVELVV